MIEKLLLNVDEACEQLGNIGRSHMYKLISTGELASIKIGRCRRIPSSELKEFIQRRLEAGA
jgi:excisionase family DNA binding protein